MNIDEWIQNYFIVEVNDSPIFKTVIVWDFDVKTGYDFFKSAFGDIIQQGIDAKSGNETIFKNIISKSVTNNYGLSEYIIRHTKISI